MKIEKCRAPNLLVPLLVSSPVAEHGENGSGGTGKILVVNSSFKEDCFFEKHNETLR